MVPSNDKFFLKISIEINPSNNKMSDQKSSILIQSYLTIKEILFNNIKI